jgi:hypothetical protein
MKKDLGRCEECGKKAVAVCIRDPLCKKCIERCIDAGHICNGCGKAPAIVSCPNAGYRMCGECHREYHDEECVWCDVRHPVDDSEPCKEAKAK